MASILITGASGLLGSNLAHDYALEHKVWGVFNQHQLALAGVRMVGADLTDERQASMVVGKVKPDLVIHCAAATDLDRCQRQPEWAFQLNEGMAANVAKAAHQYQADLIHISTDAVFSSERMPHTEAETPSPNSVYGQSKLAGEKAVMAAHPEALVVRTNLFGWNWRQGKESLAEWFLRKLRNGEHVKGFADVFFSPILVNDLGELLLRLWKSGQPGLLHVAGGVCLTKHEFGRRLALAAGLDESLIERSQLEAVDLLAPRGKHLCLDCTRAEELLGTQMPAMDVMIQRFLERKPESTSLITASSD